MVLALPPDRTLLPAGRSSVAGLESNVLLVMPLNLLLEAGIFLDAMPFHLACFHESFHFAASNMLE